MCLVVQNALYSFKELKKSLFSIVIHIPWIYLEAFLGKLLACNEELRPPVMHLKLSQHGRAWSMSPPANGLNAEVSVFLSLMKGLDLKVLQELSPCFILVGWRRGHVYANQNICSVQEFLKIMKFVSEGWCAINTTINSFPFTLHLIVRLWCGFDSSWQGFLDL